MSEPDRTGNSYSYLRKVLVFILLAAFIILAILLIGQVITVLVLLFIGVLFGIILRVLRDLFHNKTGLSNGTSLAAVVVLFSVISIGAAYFLVPQIYQQAYNFYQEIPQQWNTLRTKIAGNQWGQELARENPQLQDVFEGDTEDVNERNDATKFAWDFVADAFAVLSGFLLIFVTGIYIAAEPMVYSNGFLHLFPKSRRQQAADIMEEISMSIQWWLVGQLSAMLLIGTVTSIALWLVGMPYPLLFGIFAALMNFIPNLGPVIAAIPTVLVALTVNIELAVYVAVIFTIIQSIEGYFITPLIHRKAIEVPPVLIIATQFILFYLIGFMGILIAMPLLACTMVIVKRVYVEDMLGDSLEKTPGENRKGKNIIDDK